MAARAEYQELPSILNGSEKTLDVSRFGELEQIAPRSRWRPPSPPRPDREIADFRSEEYRGGYSAETKSIVSRFLDAIFA